MTRLRKPWPWVWAFTISCANLLDDLLMRPSHHGTIIVYRMVIAFVGLAIVLRLIGLLLGAIARAGSKVTIWPRS
jgi:hypothetical protein